MADWIPIEVLFDFNKGSLQSTKCIPGCYDFITAAEEWKTHNQYTHDCEALVFAMAASGSLGRTHYVRGKFIASDLCFILTPKKSKRIDLKFYFRILNFIREDIVKKTATGTSKLAINHANFGSYRIPYFDYDHQITFRDKLEGISSIKNALVSGFQSQSIDLAKLRQAILQEAVEGKLTTEWRKQNPVKKGDPNYDAEALLAQIQNEKECLDKTGKIKKSKLLPPITKSEKPFHLPPGWLWCRLGEITSLITSGSRNWKTYYAEKGIPLIRSQDIKKDRLEFDNKVFVDVRGNVEGDRTKVQRGDWLITITGGNVGKCAYLEEVSEIAFVSQHVALIRPLHSEIGLFGHLWLTDDFGGRKLLVGSSYGDKPGLNLNQLNLLIIPIPPLNEQKALVERVKQLIGMVDDLEKHVSKRKSMADELMQAILREAFSQSTSKGQNISGVTCG